MNQKCKAVGCDENHSQHYCRLCDDNNSNHLASNCSTGVILYHGSRCSNLESISKNGLYASKVGRIGPGVYLASRENTLKVSEFRGQGTGLIIFKCKVNLQKCFDHGKISDETGSNSKSYNSSKGIHPPWHSHPEMPEWCLKDPKKLRIVGIEMVNGSVNGDINFPRVDISISGNCTFGGNITAGNITFN
jgi:hypothetical protein